MKEAKIDAEYYAHLRRLSVFHSLPNSCQTIEMYEKIVHAPKRKLRIVK